MCEITTGYTRGICASVGGIKSITVYNTENRLSLIKTGNEITGITYKTAKVGYKIITDKESSSFTESQTRNRDNNSLFYNITGQIILKDVEDTTVDFADLLGKGFVCMAVEMDNGKYFHFGTVNGLTVANSDFVTGMLYEDMAGVTINLTGKEVSKAERINSVVYDSLLVAGI